MCMYVYTYLENLRGYLFTNNNLDRSRIAKNMKTKNQEKITITSSYHNQSQHIPIQNHFRVNSSSVVSQCPREKKHPNVHRPIESQHIQDYPLSSGGKLFLRAGAEKEKSHFLSPARWCCFKEGIWSMPSGDEQRQLQTSNPTNSLAPCQEELYGWWAAPQIAPGSLKAYMLRGNFISWASPIQRGD